MKGIVLEPVELAYLLATLHATEVVGIEDPALFPVDEATRAATIEQGLQALKDHGWLTPLPQPGQFNLNDLLVYAVAVIADPQFVVFTIRNEAPGGSRLLLHYLAGADIVELSTTADEKYALALIPDRPTMLGRIGQLLGLSNVPDTSEIRFTIAKQDFEELQDLAEGGQREAAAGLLKRFGINGQSGDSLLAALESPQANGLIVVARPNRGQIEAGRKASVFRDSQVVWLAQRTDATSNTFSVETVQADTLPTVLDNYLQFLSK